MLHSASAKLCEIDELAELPAEVESTAVQDNLGAALYAIDA